MSVPSIDGRKRDEAGEPLSWNAPAGPPPWGFWATTGWALAAIAFGLGLHIAIARVLSAILPRAWLSPEVVAHLTSWMNFVFLAAVLAPLAWVVRRAGWTVRGYFALRRPTRIDVLLAVACTGVMWVVGEAVRLLFDWGQSDVVTLTNEYRTALRNGTVVLLWIAAVVSAPLAEETFFRGFLYRGWSQSRLNVAGTILLTSVIFGLMHYQYDWYGRCEVGFFAILAGWLRWRTDSLIPPMMFHAMVGGTSMLYYAALA